MKRSAHILVVEDDDALRKFMTAILSRAGHTVTGAGNGHEALQTLSTRLVDVVLLDLRLPDADGLELLGGIKARTPGIEVVVVTGHPEVSTAVQSLKLGAYDYLTKPVQREDLEHLVAHILERDTLRSEVQSLRAQLGERLVSEDELVAASPAMHRIKEVIEQVAPTDSSVVIEGETGTGKERVAAAIHRLSKRRDGPFIPVNCAAVPYDLMESEFFGHVRGAFSGAVADSPGLFRSAHSGTLFLDEVIELSASLQAKLLRVLQEREVRPVGSAKSYPVDVRILAAASSHLEAALEDGRLRPEFFYRLNVVRIHIPPLRERKDDIPLLVAHFLRRLNRSFGRQVAGIAPDALAALLAYDFPGNVRELEHVLERAYAFGAMTEIRSEHLPPLVPRPASPEPASKTQGTPIVPSLVQAEREAIREAIERCGRDKARAAEALGISRRTLYRRLKEFGLS